MIKSFPILLTSSALALEVKRLPQPLSPVLRLDLTVVHAVDVSHLLPRLDGVAGHHVVHLANIDPHSVWTTGVIEITAYHRILSTS